MSTNGHKQTVCERLISTLELNDGQIQLRELVRNYGFERSEIDDLLEIARSPIAIRLHYNGRPQPATVVVLKNFTPPKPVPPVTQREAQARLNAMSNVEYYEMIDPTYLLRRKRRSGGGCRTSTSADEYPINRETIC
jgi:hypothetical protein